jgi:hypothetical protein
MQWHGCKVRPFLTLRQDKTHGQVQLLEYDHRRLQLLVTVFKVGKWRVGTSGCPLLLTVMSVHLMVHYHSHTRDSGDRIMMYNYYTITTYLTCEMPYLVL